LINGPAGEAIATTTNGRLKTKPSLLQTSTLSLVGVMLPTSAW